MVLYRGGRRPGQHKSYCPECGQRNFTSIKETGKKCGKCGADSRIDREFAEVYTMPGQAIGSSDPEEYAEMGISRLREEVRLVKDFDKTVTACVRAFATFCRENEIAEDVIQVQKTVKVVRPK